MSHAHWSVLLDGRGHSRPHAVLCSTRLTRISVKALLQFFQQHYLVDYINLNTQQGQLLFQINRYAGLKAYGLRQVFAGRIWSAEVLHAQTIKL